LIRATARENLAEARVMVADLAPAALDDSSLPAAIRRLADRLSAETGIAVTVDTRRELPALGMSSDVVLLRAAQETLANVRKHSQASEVHVELSAAGRGVRFSVADNGVGLTEDHAEGFGLRGMKARVAQVGGTMSVSPTPGGGVTVEVEVPT
jgi:signal transduction histidine kinase